MNIKTYIEEKYHSIKSWMQTHTKLPTQAHGKSIHAKTAAQNILATFVLNVVKMVRLSVLVSP